MTTRVPIRYGGTGANTAATARSALGVPPAVAYDQANLAYGQANSAYSVANLSYAQANNSYGQANLAYTQANSAYGQANTARDQANNAYGQANTALDQANAAYGQANTARDQANSAFGQANSAYGQANLAYTAANNAKVTVFANNGSSITTQNVNFVNTSTVTVTVTADGSNANVSFNAATQTLVNDTYTATGNTTAAATANIANGIYLIATSAYEAANNSNLKLGGAITGTLNVSQDLIVGGNIYLEGNTTFINVATYSVEDPLILLASNNTISDTIDIGIMGGKNTGGTFSHTGFARDATDAKWKLFDFLPDDDHVGNVINFANSRFATLVANLEANSVTVVGNAVATNVWVTSAFDRANLSYGQANSAYGQANLAYTQANNAYGQANLAYTQANSAYDQANLAYTAANNARVTVFANNGAANSTTQFVNFVNTASILVSVANTAGNANVSFIATDVQANLAYTAANNSANTVRISQNSVGTLSARQLNLVNTGNIKIAVTDSGDGNANLSFDATITRTNTSIISQTFTSANGNTNLTYQLIYTPWQTEFVFVNRNGVWLTPISEFTLSGNTITVIPAGEGGDTIDVRYFIDVSTVPPSNTTIVIESNTVTSQTSTFFLSQNVATINRLAVSKNGLRLTPGTHYTLGSNNTVTLVAPALVNDQVLFEYFVDLGTEQAKLGFNRDSFVGDGANANFTLSNAPANEDNCLVFVDRVLQRNSEYNVASSLLSFNSAPDSNAMIDVFVTTVSTINANNSVLKTGDTMSGNLYVNASIISQNIEPSTNITYNLGSSTKRFKDLWLSNSTIYLGEASITAADGNVSFGNATIQLSNVTTKLNVTNSAFFSGNVGIGTTTPASKLQISDSSSPHLRLHFSGSASSGNKGILYFTHNRNSDSTQELLGYIQGVAEDNQSAGGIRFVSRNNTDVEVFKITAAGTLQMSNILNLNANHIRLGFPDTDGNSQGGGRGYYMLAANNFYGTSGIIALQTNITHNVGSMIAIKVAGYYYGSPGPFEYMIGCYSGENGIYNSYYSCYPTDFFSQVKVYRRNSDSKLMFLFGGSSGNHAVAGMVAERYIHGFYGQDDGFASGWQLLVIPDTTGYTELNTMTRVDH